MNSSLNGIYHAAPYSIYLSDSMILASYDTAGVSEISINIKAISIRHSEHGIANWGKHIKISRSATKIYGEPFSTENLNMRNDATWIDMGRRDGTETLCSPR